MTRSFTIGTRTIADDSQPYCICEISHNHLGSLELCGEMIRLAAESGADAVKLQRRGDSTYIGLRESGEGEYANMRQAREFSQPAYQSLADYAHDLGLHFIATAFDPESADFLAGTGGMDAIKIASGDITNWTLLRYVAKLGWPLIVSTGGADMSQVRAAHQVLTDARANFALLHCTSEYPCSLEHANVAVVVTYRNAFPDTVIGFSSHMHRNSGGIGEVLAVANGARILENHFTVTPFIGTGEHSWAQTPLHLSILVAQVKLTRSILGSTAKRRLDAEAEGVLRLGKHLTYSDSLEACHQMDESDFLVMGGGRGVPPDQLDGLIGGTLTRAVQQGEDVQAGDIERIRLP